MSRLRMRAGLRLAATLATLLAAFAIASPALAQEHDDWPEPVHDGQVFWFVLFDNLEIQSLGDENPLVWAQEGWIGTDWNRFWLRSEGERATDGSGAGEFEVELLYSRLVAPFWEAQAGLRYDRRYGPGGSHSRAHLALGLYGMAPYWFHVEPTLFISQDGDVSARVEASYDLLLTQRLVLQPEAEIDLAVQTVEEWGVGSGFGEASLEFRLRYEFRRELAPYVGVGWSQKFGRTAELARAEGERVAAWNVMGGIRIWF